MADHLTPENRSVNMSRVRAANTIPELNVRRIAHRLGLRFRLHRKDLPGTPDLVLPRHGLVVLVHGCFWHRHDGCHRSTLPKSRTDFWRTKFAKTVERDARQQKDLKRLGWRILVIWECDTKQPEKVEELLREAVGQACPNAPEQREPCQPG